MRLLRKYKIQMRLWFQLGLVVFGILLLVGDGLNQLHSALLKQKTDATRELVESAHSSLGYYYSKEQSGELSRAEAQAQAKAAIGQLRYDETNYFWIQDQKPSMVMHPIKPELDGRNLSNSKDPTGKFFLTKWFRKSKRMVKASLITCGLCLAKVNPWKKCPM